MVVSVPPMSPSEVEVEVEVDVDVDVVDVSTCGGFSLGVKGWSLKPVDNFVCPSNPKSVVCINMMIFLVNLYIAFLHPCLLFNPFFFKRR